MSYINSVDYDFKDVRAYADPEQYQTALVKVADNASFNRYTAVSLNSSTGVISAITITPASGSASHSTKKATYTRTEGTNNFTCGTLGEYTINNSTNKFVNIESVYIYGGPYFSPSEYQILPTKADFTAGDGKITITYTYDGKTFIDMNHTSVTVYLNVEPYTQYVEGTDYTSTITKTKNAEGKDVLTAVITLIASSALDTALTANASVQVDLEPYQQNVLLTEGKDYAISYNLGATGKTTSAVITFAPGVSASAYISYKQDSFSGVFAGLVMDDIPANGARDVGIYTGGTFRKDAIPNFGAYFGGTSGFSFV